MTQRIFKICCIAIIMIAAVATSSQACVGRILYVGALETTASKTMAEMLILLINERTGTNVKIRYYSDSNKLYEAFQSHDEEARIDIIVENTADAMTYLKKERIADLEQEYLEVKKIYEQDLNVTWLKGFGFRNFKGSDNQSIISPLVRNEVLTNYPLLPRILNKLSGAIDEQTFAELIAKVNSGDKPKNVVKDFLRTKKFI